eukprot:362226-Chlamydomonas_euryale.AAC.3
MGLGAHAMDTHGIGGTCYGHAWDRGHILWTLMGLGAHAMDTHGIGGTMWGISSPNGAPLRRRGRGRATGAPEPARAGAAACSRGSTQR